MKKINLLVLLLMMVLLVSCTKKKNNNEDDNGNNNGNDTEELKEIELIEDPIFASGFNLLGISPPVDGRTIYRHLDYGKTAIPKNREVWYMAQWWTPYDMLDASYEKIDNVHTYQTESRTIGVNPDDDGYLHIELLASKEFEGPRQFGEPWPHALIEQNFIESVNIGDLEKLILTLEFKINYVENKMAEEDYNEEYHAAQLLWYVTMKNIVPKDSNPEEVGQNGDYLWFGIPIYDNRYDFLNESKQIDQGSPGTTNKLIYSMASRNYIDEKIEFGKTYNIEIDILPFLKEAFIYAANNNALVNARLENMIVDYMNFGWELPGTFDVSSTIKKLSIKAYKK